jgi:hypothetical protein
MWRAHLIPNPQNFFMDDFTADELLADAIGYVALNVLDRLADDPKAKRAFLVGFLRLIEKLNVGGLPEVGAWTYSPE